MVVSSRFVILKYHNLKIVRVICEDCSTIRGKKIVDNIYSIPPDKNLKNYRQNQFVRLQSTKTIKYNVQKEEVTRANA